MEQILFSWIGRADLQAAGGTPAAGLGPIAQAVSARRFDRIALLCDFPEMEVTPYLEWLASRTSARITPSHHPLSGPTHFGEIYEAGVRALTAVLSECSHEQALTFHLSPGTPAMAAVWIILAKTRFPAELIESSREAGVRTASVPFDISAEFIPDLLSGPDRRLERLNDGLPPEAPEFVDIAHRSAVMKRLIARARRVAPRSVPVLIEGESGTGKELLARAIHAAGPRRDRPFLAVNCGAIPTELVESELFGHIRGAFTGAVEAREGHFQHANGGTLFLDEVGELPLAAQVKLLRVLQEKQVTPVGSSEPVRIDVRVVAATNRTLAEEAALGRFRPDLFYRLAVAVLEVPPLRERPGDLGLLIDQLLERVNAENRQEPGYVKKELSVSARNLLMVQSWPGNVRELLNTLRQAAVWSPGHTIAEEDVRDSLLPSIDPRDDVLNRPLGDGLDLREVLAGVARHYLERAVTEAHGNKTKAAELVGLPSYQTLTNWLRKYGVQM